MRGILRQKLPVIVLVAWCGGLLAARVFYSGGARNTFLFWNLLLAIVPFAAASVFRVLSPRRGLVGVKGALLVIWLAFLPNAPYLVTDFVHLRQHPPVPLWFEVALFGSFAATGALLGYAAVADVEAAIAGRFGKTVAAVVATAALLLSGYGVYAGRFLRWNSWDMLTSPWALARQALHELAHPLAHRASWEMSVVYGVGLLLGYLALRSVAPVLARSADSRSAV